MRGLFSVGIAVLFLLLLQAVTTQIAPAPTGFFDYPVVNTRERCEAEGGTWEMSGSFVNKAAPRVAPVAAEAPQPYCQGPLRVERERQAQQERADRVAFFVFVIGGGIALVSGLPLLRVTPVSPGFLIAGVIGIIIGGTKLWMFAGNLARLATVIVLLIVVTIAGAFFFRDHDENAPGSNPPG